MADCGFKDASFFGEEKINLHIFVPFLSELCTSGVEDHSQFWEKK